ncbi:Hypothetical Protein RradSPS_2553 [Rubrobacter radiotolerans]|uniref:Uncharacterized protein n=1 Tax=Rubrobacter radiotolerans TaxID=42256 RepID=A0A023X6I2_RUBRA|nr:Hypothetical Protein RradSPS_2553 [Rubrobacter radiotolerans]SMC07766.1 hypothetical protein SAMN00767673_2626 [Rubrobacter radiotolerans DSM 5868]
MREARGPGRASGRLREDRVPADGREDVLLDAPQLEAKNLALSIDELSVGDVIKLKGVRLEVESLDAELLLEARLENLRVIVERLTETANLGMSLFMAPAYGFNLFAAMAYRNAEIWQDLVQAQARLLAPPGMPPNARLPRPPAAPRALVRSPERPPEERA